MTEQSTLLLVRLSMDGRLLLGWTAVDAEGVSAHVDAKNPHPHISVNDGCSVEIKWHRKITQNLE